MLNLLGKGHSHKISSSSSSSKQQEDLEEANERIFQAESAAISAREKVEEYEALCKELTGALKEKEDAIQKLEKELESALKGKEIAMKEKQLSIEKLKKVVSSGRKYTRYSIHELRSATGNFSGDSKIGEGNFGSVFKGYFHVTPVAIKVLKLNYFQGTSHFQREMDKLSGIKHPRLVMLMGACPDGGCIVWEYMPMGSLEDILLDDENEYPPLLWYDRLRIAAEVCEGLLFMHGTESQSQPLVHHNLRPSNILLDNNLSSKIADVGLVGIVTDRSLLSNLGTNTDTQSFGLLLLNLLTGRPELSDDLVDSADKALKDEEEDEIVELFVEKVADKRAKWPMVQARRFAEVAVSCARLDEEALKKAMECLEVMVAASSKRQDERMKKRVIVEEIPEGFRCPLSWRVMEDPYVASDGYSYELQEIKALFNRGNTMSPVTNSAFPNTSLFPNYSLRSAIDYWRNSTDCFSA